MNSVAPWVVFDTNSIWNFAVVERLDIVGTRYGQRVRWAAAVSDEVAVAVGYEPKLAAVEHCGFFSAPVDLASSKCLKDVARIQKILAAPGDPPTRHLGEAESIHVIEHELDGQGWFVTDDNGGADLASRRGIRVLRTDAVLRECFDMDDLQCPEPYELLVKMTELGRDGVRVPTSHSGIC